MFPPTNRSGGQVDGKERHRITRLILPSSSPLPPPSPFPPLTSWFLCFLRHRRRNDFLPSQLTLVADFAILDPPRASCTLYALLLLPPGWLRPSRWQHPYRNPSTRILTATGHWSIILGVRIFRWSDRQVWLCRWAAWIVVFMSSCLTVEQMTGSVKPIYWFYFFSWKSYESSYNR